MRRHCLAAGKMKTSARRSRLLGSIAPLALMLLPLCGCRGIGPGTVTRDRFDYVSAISDSWKKQMLLNLVKTRYADAPVFFDVASVISQYAVEGQVNFRAGENDPPWGDNWSLGAGGKYSDRPTITYTPLAGEQFTESIMRPLPVSSILSLIQAGYPADFVLRLGVQTMNGLDNRFGGELMAKPADPEFYELAAAMREVQRDGKMGMRVRSTGEQAAVVLLLRKDPNEPLSDASLRVRRLLRLDPGATEYRVVFGAVAADTEEIAILTRSMLQVLVELGSYIDVPEQDVAEGRVYASQPDAVPGIDPLIRVRTDAEKPADAHVAIKYRERWFWIEDTDFTSKRMLSFLMLLFSLTETTPGGGAPIVTVPAG